MFKFIHSIRFRVWLLFIGFTACILAFLYINQVLLLPGFYHFVKTQETTATADALRRNWDSENLRAEAERLSREHEMQIGIFKYTDGAFVGYTADPTHFFNRVMIYTPDNDAIYNALMNSRTGTLNEIIKVEERDILFFATLIGTRTDVRGYIIIYNNLQPLGNTQDVLQSQFFLSACVLFLVAFLLSLFVVRRLSNPIIKISRSARALATGDFNMKTKSSDYAEIKTLADNLNKASREIAKTENLRKDLLANVSHDLKTPLTMIKAYAEMIRDLSGDIPEKRGKHVQVIIDEADRLNGLVVDMLDLSKLQSGAAQKNAEIFDFSERLQGLLERFGYLAQEHKIALIPEIEDKIILKADLSKIEQVVYNLFNNAVNHTGNDGSVTVRLFRKRTGVGRFEVKDTGIGISKEDQVYIWERYYKAEKSEFHQRTTVGTGLGLSIVKGIMEIHGYAYGVTSAPEKGSTFWFEFPCESG